MKQNCFKSGPFSSSFPEWQKKASAAKSAIRSSSGELKLTPKAFGARRKTKLVHENFETSNKSSAEQQRKPPTGIPPLKKSWWRFLLLYRFFSPNSISSLSLSPSVCMFCLCWPVRIMLVPVLTVLFLFWNRAHPPQPLNFLFRMTLGRYSFLLATLMGKVVWSSNVPPPPHHILLFTSCLCICVSAFK